jgi:hypothetical protein
MKPREVGGKIKGRDCYVFVPLTEDEGFYLHIPSTQAREIVDEAKVLYQKNLEIYQQQVDAGETPPEPVEDMVAYLDKDDDLIFGDYPDEEGGVREDGAEEEEDDGPEEEIVDEEEEGDAEEECE